jgi:hypothetical protein
VKIKIITTETGKNKTDSFISTDIIGSNKKSGIMASNKLTRFDNALLSGNTTLGTYTFFINPALCMIDILETATDCEKKFQGKRPHIRNTEKFLMSKRIIVEKTTVSTIIIISGFSIVQKKPRTDRL